MTTHDLKIWPEYFAAIVEGKKRFELRKNDRGFKVGDLLNLHEYKPFKDDVGDYYTGNSEIVVVTYLIEGAPFLPDGVCCMSIEFLSNSGEVGA